MLRRARRNRVALVLPISFSVFCVWIQYWNLFRHSPSEAAVEDVIVVTKVTAGTLFDSIGFAVFPNGTLGHVADPNALRRTELNSTLFMSQCYDSPGKGWEEEGGYTLLTQKVRTAPQHKATRGKLFCAIYTHPPRHESAVMAAFTWGRQCDGFLAFSSNHSDENKFIVNLAHPGEESYGNMWQKVRSIWAYIYRHYIQDYDYFHLGGDDMYVVVPNLKRFSASQPFPDVPWFAGQWVRQKRYPYVAGGPGYTMNRAALERFVEKALNKCEVNTTAPYEDKIISNCLRRIGISPADTRDLDTAEQLYHDCTPHHLYIARLATGRRKTFHQRGMAYWADLLLPGRNASENLTVGPKFGLDAAARYTVSFHNLYHPMALLRIHAILYPETCPPHTPLAISLSATPIDN